MSNDLLHAWRALRAMPLVSAVIVVSLAIGIGANTVVFSWLQMVRWKPLPGVTAAYALQTIEPRTDTGSYVGASWLEYRDLRPRLGSFQSLFASRMAPLTIGDASRVERATGLFVSGNYFDDLGLRAAAGRFLTPEEAATPGGEPVVVISYDYWQSRFGGAPSAIGQPLKINGETLVVVGVTPRRFQGTVLGLAFDMWVPATMASTLIKGSRELDDRSRARLHGDGPIAAGRRLPPRLRASSTPRCAISRSPIQAPINRCARRSCHSRIRRAVRSA